MNNFFDKNIVIHAIFFVHHVHHIVPYVINVLNVLIIIVLGLVIVLVNEIIGHFIFFYYHFRHTVYLQVPMKLLSFLLVCTNETNKKNQTNIVCRRIHGTHNIMAATTPYGLLVWSQFFFNTNKKPVFLSLLFQSTTVM